MPRVNTAADQTNTTAGELNESAEGLSAQTEEPDALLKKFMVEVKSFEELVGDKPDNAQQAQSAAEASPDDAEDRDAA